MTTCYRFLTLYHHFFDIFSFQKLKDLLMISLGIGEWNEDYKIED